jgi:predicted aldo/keto reductase-like oxidoreductase
MGESESFLGEALQSRRRDSYFLMTKLPSWLVETREDMDKFLSQQLDRLKTPYIDYYLLHALDKGSWDKLVGLGVLEFLSRAQASGKVSHVGFSFHGDFETFKTIIDAHQWDVCLVQYNYLDEEYQAGTKGIIYAASRNVGVFVMEPLRGGLLAKDPPPEVAEMFARAGSNRSYAAWALSWVWDRPDVVSVLSGMSSLEQVEENCRLADASSPGMLSSREREAIGAISQLYRELLRIKCTGCMYCVPCPAGVDIPSCFELYNYRHTFGGRDAKRRYLAWLGGKNPSMASQCTGCGACLSHCPQGLDIPRELKRVRRYFEGPRPPSRAWGCTRPTAMRRWRARSL